MIEYNPLFLDLENWDFSYAGNSPCIDAGTDFYVLDGDTLIDYSENQYIGNAPDMGALEFDPLEVTPNEDIIPIEFAVVNTYPNPFNNSLSISFNLEATGFARLGVYNLQGREVISLVDSNMPAGYHSVIWNADAHASGVYFVKMVSGEYVKTQKLMLIK